MVACRCRSAPFAAIDKSSRSRSTTFNRYRTLDVIRGVAEADGRRATSRSIPATDVKSSSTSSRSSPCRPWARRTCASKGAARPLERMVNATGELLPRIHAAVARERVSVELLAIERAGHRLKRGDLRCRQRFHGVIAGCHEIPRRQGLLEDLVTDPKRRWDTASSKRTTASRRLSAT